MFIYKENYRTPITFAVALHLALFAFLFIKFHFMPDKLTTTQPSTQIINAVAINQSQLQAAQQPQQQARPQPKSQPPQIQPEKPQSVQQQQQALQQQQLEQQQAQQKLEQQQVAAERAAQKQEQRKKAAEQRKLVAQQIQQELTQQADQAKQKDLKAAQKDTQKLLQQELANSTDADAKATSQPSTQSPGEIDKYKTLIIQAISQKWIVPPNLDKGLETKLVVRLAPGGMVLDVKIVQSSGNSALDLSAQTAVYKASPLPVPPDNSLFDQFRTINLTVRPEGIITA